MATIIGSAAATPSLPSLPPSLHASPGRRNRTTPPSRGNSLVLPRLSLSVSRSLVLSLSLSSVLFSSLRRRRLRCNGRLRLSNRLLKQTVHLVEAILEIIVRNHLIKETRLSRRVHLPLGVPHPLLDRLLALRTAPAQTLLKLANARWAKEEVLPLEPRGAARAAALHVDVKNTNLARLLHRAHRGE